MEFIINIFSLVGSLALFLFGMKTMSEGLEKFAGDRLRGILSAMTGNRVMGVMTGILITALIQSSSATTVMVVSFVNAGLMTLTQSIGVIMGANIGTTITAFMASLTANTQARRAALAHLFFNVFGVVIVLIVFYPACDGVT